MRPVNLLPARYRPRTPGSGDSKSAYIALGALALLVLAVFGYVMTANKLNSRNTKIAETRQQVASAQQQSATLQGFGNFASVKEARLSAVKSLATARLDWERLFRELAHVLPEGVWLTGFNGTAAPGLSTGEVGRSLVLDGCASNHRQIADFMVRLRELHVAEDVELTKSAAPEDTSGGVTGAAATSDDGCGPYHTFEVNVTLVDPALAATESEDQTVPASLGGGS